MNKWSEYFEVDFKENKVKIKEKSINFVWKIFVNKANISKSTPITKTKSDYPSPPE